MELSQVTPPHRVNDADKLAALVRAYEQDTEVTPVVIVGFDDRAMALCGSHRIAAARVVYETFADVEEDLGWIVVGGEELSEIAEIAQDVARLADDRVGDYHALVTLLMPYLPADAQAALADQQ